MNAAKGIVKTQQENKKPSLQGLIRAMEPEIKKALPSVITPERFTRMVFTALSWAEPKTETRTSYERQGPGHLILRCHQAEKRRRRIRSYEPGGCRSICAGEV